MIGTFASVTKEVTPESTLAIKTYSKQHGKLVLEHYQREVKALKRLDLKDANSAKEHHVNYNDCQIQVASNVYIIDCLLVFNS